MEQSKHLMILYILRPETVLAAGYNQLVVRYYQLWYKLQKFNCSVSCLLTTAQDQSDLITISLKSNSTLSPVGEMCGSDKVNTTLNSDQVLAAFLSLRIDHKETKVPHVQYASYPLMICTISTDWMKYFYGSMGGSTVSSLVSYICESTMTYRFQIAEIGPGPTKLSYLGISHLLFFHWRCKRPSIWDPLMVRPAVKACWFLLACGPLWRRRTEAKD